MMRKLMIIAVAFSLWLRADSAAGEMDEYRVKALFLYNFTQFVEWPAEAFKDGAQPLSICVVSPSPFESGELEKAVKGKRIDNHPLTTRVIHDANQSSGCHVLFISANSIKRGKGSMSDPRLMGLLTVGEAPGFAMAGGVINFLVKEGRVKLEINVGSAERAKLRVSAKLLKLAEIVK